MNFLEESHTDRLKHIIAVYGNRTVVHDYISDNKKKLSTGKPLTQDSAKGIFKFIEDRNFEVTYKFEKIIPCNVLNFDTETSSIIWHTKPQIKELHFSDSLPMHSGHYPIPALVWKLTSSGLDVFAIKEEPTNIHIKLYQAPFLNTSSSGSVCMGTTKYKSKSHFYDKWINKAESAFFNSVFTHTNTDKLLTINIVDAMQEMFEKQSKIFDNDLLVETKMTLNNII